MRRTKRDEQVLVIIMELWTAFSLFPTYRKLAGAVGITEGHIGTILTRLRKKGVIVGQRGARKPAKWVVTDAQQAQLYWLLHDACDQRIDADCIFSMRRAKFEQLAARDRRLHLPKDVSKRTGQIKKFIELGKKHLYLRTEQQGRLTVLGYKTRLAQQLGYIRLLAQPRDHRGLPAGPKYRGADIQFGKWSLTQRRKPNAYSS